jgi:DNA-directed RNA polymerase specialized sigma24 family protein
LKPGEIVPLTTEQSERLGALYEAYGPQMTRYTASQLRRHGRGWDEAWSLAEDIAQSMWVAIAREGSRYLLREEPWDAQEVQRVLYIRVKQEISAYFRLLSSAERPIDHTDPATCDTLCPLLSGGCAAVELPGHLAAMVEALPDNERAALLLKLDGASLPVLADRLDCSQATAHRLIQAAVLLLQIDNPELSGPPAPMESLTDWERRAVAKRSQAQREMLLRLEATDRQALLLLSEGMTPSQVSVRLGVPQHPVKNVNRCLSALRTSGTWETRKPAAAPRLERSPRGWKSRAVADALRSEVQQMQPGTGLPSQQMLMDRFGVGCQTVQNGMKALCAEGLIESVPRVGFFVADTGARMAVAA